MRADPKQLRSSRPIDNDGVDSRLYHLVQLHDNLHGGRRQYSNVDLRPLIPLFDEIVVDELATALASQWRNWRPTLRADRMRDSRDELTPQDLIGLTGLSVEAASNPAWARNLSDEEAAVATVYATLEIDGLPEWLGPLSESKPDAVRGVLLHCIDMEWKPAPSEVRNTLLAELRLTSPAACRLVAPAILEKIDSSPPTSSEVLGPALKLLNVGIPDRATLASHMLSRFRSEPDAERRAAYLGAAFAADAMASAAAFDETLTSLDATERSSLVEKFTDQICGANFSLTIADADSITFPILRRLVDIAYRETRAEEEEHNGSGQAYALGTPEHAHPTRGVAFQALAERPGWATFEAIQSMRGSDFQIDPAILESMAEERASIDSESSTWSPSDVVSFEDDFTAIPRTAKDLQALAINRLDDLQRRLDGDDFNQGPVLASLPDEKAVQNWFANEFRRDQRLSFSIEREPHVAKEKEPDLRLQARATTAKLPIEIKVAGSWSRVQLEEALTKQLLGRYLLDPENRWGILLIVCKAKRRRGWRMPGGAYAQISEVVEHLRRIARDIAGQDADAAQMTVQLIDVSAFTDKEEDDEQE